MEHFLDQVQATANVIKDFIWGPPLLVLVVGGGLFLALRSGGIAYRHFGYIIRNTVMKMFKQESHGDGEVSSFQALSTALAGTVGTGNIVGVSGAILLGGPGSIFWMWIAAIVGMTTKFTEATLAIAYREIDETGRVRGGPMYYIKNGMRQPWLAKLYAFFAGFAMLAIGSLVQSNAISNTVLDTFHVPTWVSGIIIAVLALFVVVGGIKRIGQVTERLVPIMAVIYIIGGIIVLIVHRAHLWEAFTSIFTCAFSLQAAGGGLAGYTLIMAIRAGVSRGVFTNEAGWGSSAIAHAAATTDHPARQGMWGVFEVFADTIVICTLTALVILSTGVWQGHDNAASLVAFSFGEGFAAGRYIVTIGLILFAFSTALGWNYYGETCVEYLLGPVGKNVYRYIYIGCLFIGAVTELPLVWVFADILNGLMALPNVIGLIALSGVAVALFKDFFKDPDRIRTDVSEWKKLVR